MYVYLIILIMVHRTWPLCHASFLIKVTVGQDVQLIAVSDSAHSYPGSAQFNCCFQPAAMFFARVLLGASAVVLSLSTSLSRLSENLG